MTDLRLVVPALSAWAASIAVLNALSAIESTQMRHSVAVRVLQACLLVALVAFIVWRRRIAVVIAVAAGSLGVAAAASQVSAWTTPALDTFTGTQVQMVGVVDGPPREVLGALYLPVSSTSFQAEAFGEISVPVSVVLPRFSAVPIPGTTIRVQGQLRPAGTSLRTAAYLDAPTGLEIEASAGVIDRAAQRVRDALHASLPPRPTGGAALVAGLAIGDEDVMSPQLRDQMRSSGLSHLTAVSGGNVAIVVGAVLALAWLLRLPMLVRICAALVVLVFYVIVVHPQPSVLRAAVMGAVVILSLLVGGRRPGPSILATGVLLLVVLAPSLSVSWGFALSVAATAGIVMLTPGLSRRIQDTGWGSRVPTPVVVLVALTLAAQLATAPVLLAMGADVGLVAVPANVLAMPVVPIVTIAGLAAAVIGLIPGLATVAEFIAWVGALAGEWIAQVAVHASAVDVLRIRGSLVVAAGLTLATCAAVWVWRRGPWSLRLAVGLGVVVAATLWVIAPPDRRAWPPSNWLAVQCDVGQGDALVIAPLQDAGAVVVDTGVSARVIDRCLEDLDIEHVSALVLTHFHSDHVNGLTGVLDGRRVDAVFSTVAHEPVAQATGVLHELQQRGLRLQHLRAGMTIDTGTRGSADAFRVIWPRRIITADRISEGSLANNASVVLDVRVRGIRLLLTGDIEPPAQVGVMATAGDYDVVKVPHHGSVHQQPGFARWADAELALVSVGTDNGFGHPAAETIGAWRDSGAHVVRTDQVGDIAVVVDDAGRLSWVGRRGAGEGA